MDIYDLFALPIYLGIIYFLANIIRSRNANNPLYRKYFIKGLNYKIGGVIGFMGIYWLYYNGGDNTAFFCTVEPTYKLFFKDPSKFFSFVFSSELNYPQECMYYCRSKGVGYLARGSAALTTIRICALLNLFAFNSYVALTLLTAFISYIFTWRAFRLFASLYPPLEKEFVIAFLMIPSVLFWGSGIGKDSISFACIMNMVYCFYEAVIQRKRGLRNIILFVITAYIISLIRSYILYTVLPGLLLMAGIYYRNLFQNVIVRFVALPIFLAAGIAGSFFMIKSIGSSATASSYSLDKLGKTAEGFHSWHTTLGETQGGSFYSLGDDVDYSPVGIMKKAPLALVITLFGPFIWQIRNPVMMMSGVESLIFLYFFIRVFFTVKLYKAYDILFKDHVLMLCVLVVVVLGIAIGITSFNYGALVRYKIPTLPFFAVLIAIANYRITGKGLFATSSKK